MADSVRVISEVQKRMKPRMKMAGLDQTVKFKSAISKKVEESGTGGWCAVIADVKGIPGLDIEVWYDKYTNANLLRLYVGFHASGSVIQRVLDIQEKKPDLRDADYSTVLDSGTRIQQMKTPFQDSQYSSAFAPHPIFEHYKVSKERQYYGLYFDSLPEFTTKEFDDIVETCAHFVAKQLELHRNSAKPKWAPTHGLFALDQEERKAIEEHAVKLAKEFYIRNRYGKVTSYEAFKVGYDLEVKGSDIRLVEVKGTRGKIGFINFTNKEFLVATNRKRKTELDLFIVSEIQVSGKPGQKKAAGCKVLRRTNWRPDPIQFKPTQYTFDVAKHSGR